MREYIRDTSVLILDGGVLKESSKDCFTHAVLQQLARNPTFVAGSKSSGQVASLGWVGHEHWALGTLAEAQATMRVIHAGLRQIFSEEWLENALEAFDIHAWMQVDDAKGAMPVKRKCMIACFRKLAIAKKCQPFEGHYTLVMDFSLTHYRRAFHNNGKQELMKTEECVAVPRKGFNDALATSPSVEWIRSLLSFFFS